MCLEGRVNCVETLRGSKAEARVSPHESSAFSLHKACGPTSLASYCGTFTIWAGQCAIARSSREHRRERCSLIIYSFRCTCTHITKHSPLTAQPSLYLRSLDRAPRHRSLPPSVSTSRHSCPTCHNPRPPKMRSALWRRGVPPQPNPNYTRSRNQR